MISSSDSNPDAATVTSSPGEKGPAGSETSRTNASDRPRRSEQAAANSAQSSTPEITRINY